MMQTTLMFTLLATATATMTKWDTTCGSKFDRIDTTALTMTTAGGKFAAGDTVTIDTSGSCNLHGPFMGGAWSVRVYEEGFAHPVGDFYGDFSKVLSFPDAKNTTFKIDGVQFMLPNLGSTSSNIFQISFTAQDFQHATYFCVDIYYNLDTGKMTTTKNVEASLLTSLMTADAPHQCTTDADCANDCSFCMNDPSKHPPFYCHAKEKGCCDNDKDCPGSYCMNSPGKKKPFYCHGNLDEAPELVKENKKQTCASFGGCYCKSNHYCHVPPQPIHCTTDAQCRSSWYPSSYCQNPDKMGTCHLNMPPRCEQDSDCDGKGTATAVMKLLRGDGMVDRKKEKVVTNCKSDKDCPLSYCMNDPTKSTPFNCHNAAPSGEIVLNGMLDKNHCQEVHVANSQFKSFWAAVGNWKYAHYARGECASKFNTKDSIKHDVNWPTAIVIKKGEAATLFAAVVNKMEKVLHAESKTHCNEVHVPKSEYKAFMADKGWSFKDYKTGDCEATWNTKEKVTRDTKYKGVYYVKKGKKTVDPKKEKVLHAESKTHCNEVHVPKSEYKAFMADKGWSFKDYKTGDCEAAWNTKEKVTRDTKYKGVYYVKKGKKTSLRKIITKEQIIRPTSPNADNETISHSYPDKNHCTEIHVPTLEYLNYWRRRGKWMFPNSIDGYCEDKYNSNDSVKPDKIFPDVTYIKMGIVD